MRYRILAIAMVSLLATLPAAGADVRDLATCTTKVFNEINRTRQWSGKAPAGCAATVAVEKRADGIFVAAWTIEATAGGWVRTALSSAAGYAEVADKKILARANREIVSRAARLGKCLDSIKAVNDPLECRTHATKSYLVDEVTGTEHNRLIWLDDNGRHTVVEYSFGDTEATPTPPADLFEGTPIQPGVIIQLYREVNAPPSLKPNFAS